MTFDRYYGNAKCGIGVCIESREDGYHYTAHVVWGGEVADLLAEDGPFDSESLALESAYNTGELWCLEEGIEPEGQ